MVRQLDFNSIIEEGGVQFLYNESQENILKAQLERLDGYYKDIRALLQKTDLPTNPDYIRRVAREGSDGLRGIVVEMTEKHIIRLSIPSYLAESFRRNAPSEIPQGTWNEADELQRKITADEDGLPILADDYIFQEDAIINADAIAKRISEGCRIPITDTMKAEADKVLQLAKELRALDLTGLNCIELATKYARSGEEHPTPVSLFNDITFRRHTPGWMGMDEGMARVINETSLRNAGLIN